MKKLSIPAGIIGLFLFLIIAGCAPINAIFVGANFESSAYELIAQPEMTIYTTGEKWFGALRPGQTMILYSRTDSVPDGGHIQVYNSLEGYLGLSVGYYNVDEYPEETAQIIRDQWLEWYPPVDDYFKNQIQVSWADYDTQFPKYQIVVFPQYVGGQGTVHRVRIITNFGTTPTLRVVDANGSVVYTIEPGGRVGYVREAGNFFPPKIREHNMLYEPPEEDTPPIPNPSIKVDRELGYLVAGIIEESSPGCYAGKQIAVHTEVRYDPVEGLYTYNFYPAEPLVSGQNYLFFIGAKAPFGFKTDGPYEKLTQGLDSGETPLDCSQPDQFPCGAYTGGRPYQDLGKLGCGDASNTIGLAFYFKSSSTWWGDLIPEIPEGYLIPGVSGYVVDQEITPEEEDISAVVSFPPGYDIETIEEVQMGCAKAYKFHYIENKNAVVVWFHRNDFCHGDLKKKLVRIVGKTRGGFKFFTHAWFRRCHNPCWP